MLSCFPHAKYTAVGPVVMDTACRALTDLDSHCLQGIDRLKLSVTQQRVVPESLAGQARQNSASPLRVLLEDEKEPSSVHLLFVAGETLAHAVDEQVK